ncbi:hypothetical protein HYH02_001083 [Chlamydomonas schloesseri]|uniref:BRO1 domain-containing protein n=1 Tax=Chlamydomonas schloesseri TaxID=2026947 RepID=A0A836BC15_9CHLO|nr:hypothetical protein HYH02_001083 [Chlamydomonas schloesseri]|eukprot:KAG2454042.1 hypothetical protein HYH02_001083 [Chlamydomonas schloesseri]
MMQASQQQLALKAATGVAFTEPWLSLSTKPFDYSAAFSKQGGAAAGAVAAAAMAARPESILELTFQRGALSTWMQQPAAAGQGAVAAATKAHVPEGLLEGLAGLAARLHGLMDALAVAGGAAAPGGKQEGAAAESAAAAALDVGVSAAAAAAVTAGTVRSEWTSALSSKPQRMLRLDSLPQELAMVYTAYAAALRQAAWQRAADATAAAPSLASDSAAAEVGSSAGGAAEGAASLGGSARGGGGSDAGAVAALTAAVAGLRRAAGVYDWLAAELLPALGGGAAAGSSDVPLELLPAAARCMSGLCLAEAQALMAAAAEARGMSPGARRALHGGCVTLLKGAEASAGEVATVAAATAGAAVSDRLLRLLGAGGALHAAAGCYCLGLERQKELELGEAEAAAEECRRLLECGLKRVDRSDPPSWADSFKALQAAAAQLSAAAHKDRLAVTYQPLPKQPPDASANAAVRVATEPFQPAPVRPLAPLPDAAGGKGGCVIM